MIRDWLNKLKGSTAELKVNEELKENEVMSAKAQKEMLRNAVYETMKARAKNNTMELVHYVRKQDNEPV